VKAIVLKGPNDFSLQSVEEPTPGPDEVEIRVRFVGICGTDLLLLRGGNPFVPYPIVPGHESMGEVLRAPADSTLKEGDRVTVFPAYGCGKCDACKAGRIPHCPEARTEGVLRPRGYFAERIVAHHQRVFTLPASIEDEVGAMVEPTAVAVHANRRAGLDRGARVVVIGGGTIGLLAAQVAKAYGASQVVLSEPISERRALARRLGIDQVCNPLETDPISFVRRTGDGVDGVLDVVGTQETLAASEEMLRPDGRLVLVAMPHQPTLAIPYQGVFSKELNVVGSRTYFVEDFPEAIRLLETGQVEAKPLIGAVLPMERFTEAVELLEKHPERYVKILISPLM